MKEKRLLKILGVSSILLFGLGAHIIFSGNWPYVRDGINKALSNHLQIAELYWLGIIIVSICHFMATKDKHDVDRKGLTLGIAYGPTDLFCSAITYGTMFQTALLTINGIYKRFFYDAAFFEELSKGGLVIILYPMLFFLFGTIVRLIRLIKRTYWVSKEKGRAP